jgi:hypothetical protein
LCDQSGCSGLTGGKETSKSLGKEKQVLLLVFPATTTTNPFSLKQVGVGKSTKPLQIEIVEIYKCTKPLQISTWQIREANMLSRIHYRHALLPITRNNSQDRH